MTNPLCAQCVFFGRIFGNFRVSGPDTEHESVFLFVPDPCMRLVVMRQSKEKKSDRPKHALQAFEEHEPSRYFKHIGHGQAHDSRAQNLLHQKCTFLKDTSVLMSNVLVKYSNFLVPLPRYMRFLSY